MEKRKYFAGGLTFCLMKTFSHNERGENLIAKLRSKSFDAGADGTGIGEGCGVLMLKPLEKR